ncbi:MAG: YafY family transcriptional regulator [Pseudomonadota bacterium]|nr:YafY family transcriptional regulator [Pseudomonadota bacterium]
MPRSHRLLVLLDLLRRHRYAVNAATLAAQVGVTVRTLYRDIDALRAQGADIDGAPGVGYVLRPGFMLPPLMFGMDELEALVLGSRWVMERGDPHLANAAEHALAKIAAVLPPSLRRDLDDTTLLIGPASARTGTVDMAALRRAIRNERTLHISYRDKDAVASERQIWPFALGFFERDQVVLAWCEMREDFRAFRTDRILTMTMSETRYPQRRQALLKAWRAREAQHKSASTAATNSAR